jgi:KDO2-lipid IV(A) lauroyltransferase
LKKIKIRHYIEYSALKSAMFFIRLMPRSLAHKIGVIFAVFAYYFVPVRKKHIIDMLTLSFPEKTPKEIKSVTKEIYVNFAGTFIDIMFFPAMSGEEIKNLMFLDAEGEEIFAKVHSKGKGAILMSAHFGNWELTALSFSKRYPMSVIVAKQSNGLVDKLMNEIRTKQGFHAIYKDPPGTAFRNVMKALRNNEFVAVLSDQDAGKQGVFIPFFGRPASTPKGAAIFALKAKCPIVTAFGVRQKDGSMKMKIGQIPLPDTGNEEEDIKTINGIYYGQLEAAVREHPGQWFWFHKKWKTRQKTNGDLS